MLLPLAHVAALAEQPQRLPLPEPLELMLQLLYRAEQMDSPWRQPPRRCQRVPSWRFTTWLAKDTAKVLPVTRTFTLLMPGCPH